MMPIVFFNNKARASLQEKFFEDIAVIFYKTAKFKKHLPISFAILNNNDMQKFNKIYRGIDAPTDVLSFSEKDSIEEFPIKEKFFGEIIISLQKAREQAKKNKHSLESEMCILFVHGLAHLSGYGHNNNSEEKVMKKLEKNVLEKVSKKIGMSIHYD